MLIARPKPFPKELMQSYLYRLARLNGYKVYTLSLLFKKHGVPIHSFKYKDRERMKSSLVEMTGHEELLSLLDPWDWAGHRGLFNYTRIKLCPECYRFNGYLSKNTCFRHILTCPEHECHLIDTCTQCYTLFNGDALISGVCTNCNFLIENMRSLQYETGKFDEADKYWSVSDDLTVKKQIIVHDKKLRALSPYFYMVEEGQFESWTRKCEMDIPLVADTLGRAIILCIDPKLGSKALVDYVLSLQGYRSSMGMLTGQIEKFMSSLEYGNFERFFRWAILENCDRFEGIIVEFRWISRVYGVSKGDLETNADAKHINLLKVVNGWGIECCDLKRLLTGIYYF